MESSSIKVDQRGLPRSWQKFTHRITFLRPKTLPILLIGFAVLAVGAGAAVGAVMGGKIEGSIPITVNQALVTEKPQKHLANFPSTRKFFSTTSDNQAKFSFALDLFRGESLTVLVPIVNRGAGDVVGETTIVMPDIPSLIDGEPGLTVDIVGSGLVDDVVQTSSNVWVFTGHASLNGTTPSTADGLLLTFTVANTTLSGFFEITGSIKTAEF